MFKVNWLLCSFVLLFLSVSVHAQNALCRVRLYPPDDRNKRNEMLSFLDADHFKVNGDKSIDVEISQSDLKRLKQSSYRYTVLVPDISKYLDSVNKTYFEARKKPNYRVGFQQAGGLVSNIIATPAAFQVKSTFAGYYRFSEIEAAIDALVAAYPTIASKQSIDTTINGRNIWVVKISDNVGTDENEPECLFMGLQHAREAMGGSSMIFFMQYLCEQYMANNPRIRELVDNREIYIIPCFNPDGWEYNYTSTNGAGGGSWRKNREPNGDGTYGADLNRNWGVDWGNCNTPIQGNASSCGSNNTSLETYYGPSAFSERETQALRRFTKTRNFKTAFDQHAFGPYYSIPPGRESLHNSPGTQMTKKDSNFYYLAIPVAMGKYNGMRTANSFDALGYEVAGGFKDWMMNGEIGVGTKDTIWAMTGEGGAGDGNQAFASSGMSDFWAPASQIEYLAKGMCYQNLQLALGAGTYAEVEDASDIALTAKTGTVSFNLTRLGLGNNPITVSLLPLLNMSSAGTPVTYNSLSYYQTVQGSISYTLPAAITNGQKVKFVWRVQADGITYYDTVTKFYNPTVMFSDNMEGTLGTKWTQSTSDGGSSGFGYTYADGNWLFTSGGYGGSGNALSESANGSKYTGSTRSVIKCSTAFDLSNATAAYLTFWTRHKLENFRDKVQVQFSTNGTTWTAVKGVTTIQEPGTIDGSTINGEPALTGIKDTWTQERFDLDAYRGSSSVQFRFVFTSDNDPTSFAYERDEGIFIDNVQLIKSTTTQVILPVNFLSFAANLQPNRTVQLNWNVANDTKSDRYEIERSVDGSNFIRIGTVKQGNALTFVDAQPTVGTNYYRLKQIDFDGKNVYSAIATVTIKASSRVTAYPNPFADKLNVQVIAEDASEFLIDVMDASGHQIYSNKIKAPAGLSELKIDAAKWPSQLYVVKVIDLKSQEQSFQKIIKN